jgi:hypothetical protein
MKFGERGLQKKGMICAYKAICRARVAAIGETYVSKS